MMGLVCRAFEAATILRFATVLACSAVCGTALAQPVDLVPVPKSMRTLSGTMRPNLATYSLAGEPSPRAEYALEALGGLAGTPLQEAEAGNAGISLTVASSHADLTRAASALQLQAAPADRWQEAFVLDAGVGAPERITLVAGPVGLIYGAFAITHLVNETDDGPALPRVAISDWPSLLTRGYTGCVRDVSAKSLSRLDWLARWRLNAAYYEIYGDQGQDGAPPEVADIHRECARRGITLYGLVSNWRTERLLKRELCASNPEDLAHIRRYCNELLDRGCEGLIFLFDDITQGAVEHVSHCEKCKGRFSGLAEAQLELMRPMIEVAGERGVSRLIVCPSPYWDHWRSSYGGKLLGEEYYPVWRDAKQMDNVQVYHCLLRRDRVAEVQQAGLRNYIYWFNGAYDYYRCTPGRRGVDGIWGGLTQLAFGWYCSRWDREHGLMPLPDTYDAFRELPRITQHAWLCGGGEYPWALWGCYCWNVEAFDPVDTERRLVAAMYGVEAATQYAKWRDITRKWLPSLIAPRNVTDPAKRASLLQALQSDAAQARQSAGAFRALTAKATGAVAPESSRLHIASRMVESGETLSQLADSAASEAVEVKIGKVSEAKLAKGTRRERRIEIGNFWDRYTLRYSQTQEPDGALHRSQWHFGSGLGMLGPSNRNWYDAGFIDVLLGDESLDTFTPEFQSVPGPSGDELLATWRTDHGVVSLRFSLFEGGLRVQGNVSEAGDAPLAVRLFAIPGAGWGEWKDMDKYVVTAAGEVRHGTAVTLDEGHDWIFLADRTYDIPRELAEGPCAVLFGTTVPTVRCDNAGYVVHINAAYPAGASVFDLVVWDFHGRKNEEAIAEFRTRIDDIRRRLNDER